MGYSPWNHRLVAKSHGLVTERQYRYICVCSIYIYIYIYTHMEGEVSGRTHGPAPPRTHYQAYSSPWVVTHAGPTRAISTPAD